MGAIVASGVNSSLAAGHPRPVAFVNGYHHAVEVAAIIALTGAVIAAGTLKHARHRPQQAHESAFPEAA
jgi:Flp pilus assembly protein TadB